MPSQKQYTERTDNIRAIFSALRECGSLTRNEISQKLGLSWACVSDLTAMLISEGIALARSPSGEKSFRGRTPSYLCLSEENCFLGVDINNNGITFRKESAVGELIAVHTDKREIDTEDALSEIVLSGIEGMLSGFSGKCLGIGVAMQGQRSEATGLWGFPAPGGYIYVDPEKMIGAKFKMPVTVRHDPECMLYAFMGNGERKDTMTVRVDGGIGVAVMKRGEMLTCPLELGETVTEGGVHLSELCTTAKIISSADKTGACRALSLAVANLALLLDVERVILCGEAVREYLKLGSFFSDIFSSVCGGKISLSMSEITDAAGGAVSASASNYFFVGGVANGDI